MNIPHRLRAVLLRRVETLMVRRKPDFVIGDNYLHRWHLLPRNAVFSIYAHRFLHSDEDRALHDHPYLNASILLDGQYIEHTPNGAATRFAGAIVCRRAVALHRIELIDGAPAISLFIVGPRIREWGFACPKGWRPWRQFVEIVPGGNKIGRGCD